MIVYPQNWKKIGVAISPADVEGRIVEVLKEMDCNCLSLSGGVDSSLLLYYMCQVFKRVIVFTIGLSEDHPDVKFAREVFEYNTKTFPWVSLWHWVYCPTKNDLKGSESNGTVGDTMVRAFYEFVAQHTDKIITGDVIDEYTCGYYAHQDHPTEEIYYDFIRRLQKEHLVPLDKNSGEIKVYLPYADEKIIAMLSQIPLKDKVDSKNRKKVIIEMAKGGNVPDEVIVRRKYGFCDALKIKGGEQ